MISEKRCLYILFRTNGLKKDKKHIYDFQNSASVYIRALKSYKKSSREPPSGECVYACGTRYNLDLKCLPAVPMAQLVSSKKASCNPDVRYCKTLCILLEARTHEFSFLWQIRIHTDISGKLLRADFLFYGKFVSILIFLKALTRGFLTLFVECTLATHSAFPYARISFRMKLMYARAKPTTTSMIMATRCGQIWRRDCPRLR